MTKFKVGQRVQCVKSWLGKIEAVCKVIIRNDEYLVLDGYKGHGG